MARQIYHYLSKVLIDTCYCNEVLVSKVTASPFNSLLFNRLSLVCIIAITSRPLLTTCGTLTPSHQQSLIFDNLHEEVERLKEKGDPTLVAEVEVQGTELARQLKENVW